MLPPVYFKWGSWGSEKWTLWVKPLALSLAASMLTGKQVMGGKGSSSLAFACLPYQIVAASPPGRSDSLQWQEFKKGRSSFLLVEETSVHIFLKVLVAQSCLTLSDPMDCSLPGSSVHGILQARILEWITIPFSRVSSWPRDQPAVSCTAGRFFTVWAKRETPYIFLWEHKVAEMFLCHRWLGYFPHVLVKELCSCE